MGPVTVAPLAFFAWTTRRLPLSTVAFLQFIGPSMGFLIGLAVGERLNPLGVISFAFIWAGVAVFTFGAWRAGRRLRLSLATA
jgi:chloramphenicol-sensitive protein RarD